MNLQDYLDGITREAEAGEAKHDMKSIIAKAKAKGLLQAPGEAAAFKVVVRRKLAEIDKSAGEKAAELATMQSRWMDVTPAMAEMWLQHNFNNRPVSLDTVRAYAREMKRGKWLPNHQGIAFNDRDELNDGQHRLMAIVLSGCTVRLMVTFGLPSKVKGTRMTGMDVVDRGKTRTVADQLKIQHGMTGGGGLAMICTRIAGICSPERTRRLSVGEILDIHEVFEREVDFMIERRPKEHGIKQAGVLAAFAFAMASARGGVEDESGPAIEAMFDQLTGKTEADARLPMMLLREFLTGDAAILLTRGNDRALAELVLQAIWQQLHRHPIKELAPGLEGRDYFTSIQRERVAKIASMFVLPDAAPLVVAKQATKKGARAA